MEKVPIIVTITVSVETGVAELYCNYPNFSDEGILELLYESIKVMKERTNISKN